MAAARALWLETHPRLADFSAKIKVAIASAKRNVEVRRQLRRQFKTGITFI
jgi:hypothetical protein